MGVADAERQLLCELFDKLGPEAPTLCGGWQTRDLAAHLVLRERRFDAAPGILISGLSGYTDRVQRTYAAKPWPELVSLVRGGPPRWSPFAIPAVNQMVNTTEYFVHHEDVRRAQPEWELRPADAARDKVLWLALQRVGRMGYRKSPVGVVLRRSDGGGEITAKRGPNMVSIVGEPGELLLHAFGRSAVRVSFDGDQSSIAAIEGLDRSF
jgi:uncharacterized protein (TIGR03085 family)